MIRKTLLIVASACVAWHANAIPANAYYFGQMSADRVLFLGNSITLTLPNNWGASASAQANDYVHLLSGKIDAVTGGSLELTPMDKALVDGEQQPGTANILNVAHIFERNYRTYSASKLQYQIDKKPDIVVLQFGENIPDTTTNPFDATAFETALRTLVTDLQTSSNPHMFFASYILGSNSTVDAIKKKIVAEDPKHRIFVDLSAIGANPSLYIGDASHPSDAGMALIANTMFKAMQTHAVPEPSCVAMLIAATVGLCCYAWKKRRN
jgi:hypothetical protein